MSVSQENDTHHISRIDVEPCPEHPDRASTHGWLVRVCRQGQRISKFFSDKKHGGKEKALYDHAIPYRDRMIDELPPPENAQLKSARVRSRTGVVGLRLVALSVGCGSRKPYIQIGWTNEDGRRRNASFSVEKWGLKRALWYACKRLHQVRTSLNQTEYEHEPETLYRTAYPNVKEQYVETFGQAPPEMDQTRAFVLGVDDPEIPVVVD